MSIVLGKIFSILPKFLYTNNFIPFNWSASNFQIDCVYNWYCYHSDWLNQWPAFKIGFVLNELSNLSIYSYHHARDMIQVICQSWFHWKYECVWSLYSSIRLCIQGVRSIGLHSNIAWKYIGCLRKVWGTNHMFCRIEHPIFGSRFGLRSKKFVWSVICSKSAIS